MSILQRHADNQLVRNAHFASEVLNIFSQTEFFYQVYIFIKLAP